MLKTVTGMLAPHCDVMAVSDGKAALDTTARITPDLVLADILMPKLDGIRMAAEMKRREPQTRIVFLTGQEDDDYISEALAVGATGYIVKRRLHSDLLPAVKLALQGQRFISPHSFIGAPKNGKSEHVLRFYADEGTFVDHTYQLAYTALAKGDRVLAVLGQTELRCLTTRLRATGLNLAHAIELGRYVAFSVESVMPLILKDNWPDAALFATFFNPTLRRLSTHARRESSQVTIFADIIGPLLRQGCSHEVATRVEEIWNNLVQRHSCIIYCGCPVIDLGCKRNRATLAEICHDHSSVIPIGR